MKQLKFTNQKYGEDGWLYRMSLVAPNTAGDVDQIIRHVQKESPNKYNEYVAINDHVTGAGRRIPQVMFKNNSLIDNPEYNI